MTRLFENDSVSSRLLVRWWKNLEENTGDRASLRRARNSEETIQIPYVHDLIRDLRQETQKIYPDKIGAICGVLSHVKNHEASYAFAKKMYHPRTGSADQPMISNIRFRRILQYDDITRDELFYQNIVRIIKNLDHTVNIIDLAHSLYHWGNYTIKRWAYDYYGTNFANEDTNQTNGETK